MTRRRIPETDKGIQGEANVEIFDTFRRRMRDQGRIQVENIFEAGINGGAVLEVGPGPGYFGLEWLKQSDNGRLTGIEISPDMLELAARNAGDYGLGEKSEYVLGNAMEMPFGDNSFDAVISNGSLHEWQDPVRVFREIYRVLKPGGRFCVIDLCREANPIIAGLIKITVKPKEAKSGFVSSLNAAYTAAEVQDILKAAGISKFVITRHPIALGIAGEKTEKMQ